MMISKSKIREIPVPKKISIFFYVDSQNGSPKLGGAERRLSRIFDELATGNFQAEILLKVEKKSSNIQSLYENVLKKNQAKVYQFESYIELFKHMRKEKYNWICYSDSYRAMIPYLIFGIGLSSKRMMLNVTTYTSNLIFLSKNQRNLFNLVVKKSHHLDVLYPSGFEKLKENYPEKNITLTPGAFTDLNVFKPIKKINKIIFLSSLIDLKNPILFIESISLAKKWIEQKNYLVEIYGSGPLEEDVKLKIKELQCENIIKFYGQIEPEKVLPETSVFLSIQKYNNYPSQALLEAISSGCYIIASNEGDTNKIVREDFGKLCGLNKEEIAQAIVEYLNMSMSEKNIIVKKSRDFALDEFKLEYSVKHYKELFEREDYM